MSSTVTIMRNLSLAPEIKFTDFAALGKKRGWTIKMLADRFRGTLDDPLDFFTRVMTCKYHGEYRGDVVIPYRSVLAFYKAEVEFDQRETNTERRCACGCGQRVWRQKKWASSACRKRGQRNKSQTPEI